MTDEERQDREAIRLLMARYNMAGDQGRTDRLAASFTEDGVLRFNNESSQGPAAIVARLTRRTRNPALSVTRHHLGASLVEIENDSASGRTYFAVMTDVGLDHHGVYVDRFRRVEDDWKIARREVRIDWQSPQSLNAPLWVRGRPPSTQGS